MSLSLVFSRNNASYFSLSCKISSYSPSPALLPFSGLSPAPPQVSFRVWPKTKHTIQCAASTVLSTVGHPFSGPAGHTVADTGQDTIGLGHLDTQLAPVQLVHIQHPLMGHLHLPAVSGSSVLSRSLLDCLFSAVLYFQQTSTKLKSPKRYR